MPLPVELLGERHPGALRALILSLDEESPGEARADLVLGDGGRAFAYLQRFDLAQP